MCPGIQNGLLFNKMDPGFQVSFYKLGSRFTKCVLALQNGSAYSKWTLSPWFTKLDLVLQSGSQFYKLGPNLKMGPDFVMGPFNKYTTL